MKLQVACLSLLCCFAYGFSPCGNAALQQLESLAEDQTTTEDTELHTTNYPDTESRQIFTGSLPSFNAIVPVTGSSCKTSDDEPGTCLPTAAECTRQGGTATGNCNTIIAGTAVCCVFIVKSCGETSVRSPTIWQKPKTKPVAGDPCTLRLPAVPVASSTASVIPLANTIASSLTTRTCQIRIDFIDFNLAGPSATSVCDKDSFRIVGTADASPTLCGNSYANQHMYLTYNSKQDDIVLTFLLQSTSSKDWKLQITRIPCNSADLAPSDCLQYFTETSGMIQSFNFQQRNLITSQLANQDYSVCIKKLEGYCSICYEACDVQNEIPGFSISGDSGTASSVADAADCPDQLIVPGASDGIRSAAVFCGTALNPTAGARNTRVCTPRFRVDYITDDTETATEKNNVGFCLNYSLKKCT